MKTYRTHPVWIISTSLLTCIPVIVVLLNPRDWRSFLFLLGVLTAATIEWTTRVTVDDEKLVIAFKFFPFLPNRVKASPWNNVIGVRASPDLLFLESSRLVLICRLSEGKTKDISIPLFTLRHRRDLVREIISRLPSHVVVPPDLMTWVDTYVRYPKWQIIFLIGGVIFGTVMFWSAYRESHPQSRKGIATGSFSSGADFKHR